MLHAGHAVAGFTRVGVSQVLVLECECFVRERSVFMGQGVLGCGGYLYFLSSKGLRVWRLVVYGFGHGLGIVTYIPLGERSHMTETICGVSGFRMALRLVGLRFQAFPAALDNYVCSSGYGLA